MLIGGLLADSNMKEKTSESQSKKQVTFGLVKPEAFDRGLIQEIERRIEDSGLKIVDKKVMVMDEHQLDILYGHVRSKRPEIYELLRAHMRRPVEVLIVEGEDAVERLLKIRGSPTQKESQPGTIRGDLAKDQVYDPKTATTLPLNLFHAADSIDDANRLIDAFSNSMKRASRK
jgi:nucleoside-diphosphate kinase